MSPTSRVPASTSWSSGSARIGRDRLDLGHELRHAFGGGVDAGDRGLGAAEHRGDLLDDLRLHRLVDQARAEASSAARSAGACLMPLEVEHGPEVGEQRPEVLGRRADALVGDERVEVAEQGRGVLHHLLERQVGDALDHALDRGGDVAEVGRDARDHRVRLGVAVERPRAARRAARRARPAATGRSGRWSRAARAAQRHLRLEGVERGPGGIGRVVGDADPARGDGEGGAQRHLRPAGVVDDRRLQRLDLADLQAAEAHRRARLQPADRALEQGVDEHPLAGRFVEEVLPRRASDG